MSAYEYAMLVLRRLRVHRVTRPDGSTEDLQDLAEPTLVAWFNQYVRPPVEAAYAEESRRWSDRYAAWRGQVAVTEKAARDAPWLVRYPDGRAGEVYAPDAHALEARLRHEFVLTGQPEPQLLPHAAQYQEWGPARCASSGCGSASCTPPPAWSAAATPPRSCGTASRSSRSSRS